MWKILKIAALCSFLASLSSMPADAATDALQPLRTILEMPEAGIDLAEAKLAIDRLIDPNTDVPGTLKKLDAMAQQIKRQLPPGANRRATLVALLTFLHQPGPWNDQHAYSYDLDDPFGKNLRNKLLATYLATRKGNCVSMPILFVILAQKIGLEATLSTAPEHVFAKVRDDDGQMLNIEATSGGTKSDAGYQEQMDITPQARTNGIYLRTLSKRESVAVMMGTLMELYGRQDQQDRRITAADLALSVFPNDVEAMLHKSSASYRLLKRRYLDIYPSSDEIPAEQRADFERLGHENIAWAVKAAALGWREPTSEQNASYEKSVQRTKSTTRQGEQ